MPRALIVGSGIAGLFCGLSLSDGGWDVAIVTKSSPTDSSTNWAQGGIAGILDKTDGAAMIKHVSDTLDCGAGHCDIEVVESVVREAGDRILDLLELGVNFEKDVTGDFDLAREGGHSEQRILHCKDATGAEI